VSGPDKPTSDGWRAMILLAHLNVVSSHRNGERCDDCAGKSCSVLATSDRIVRLILGRQPSRALLVATPSGSYHVSANGFGDGIENASIISRAQLHTLIAAQGMRLPT
jgi:hypothetical protein